MNTVVKIHCSCLNTNGGRVDWTISMRTKDGTVIITNLPREFFQTLQYFFISFDCRRSNTGITFLSYCWAKQLLTKNIRFRMILDCLTNSYGECLLIPLGEGTVLCFCLGLILYSFFLVWWADTMRGQIRCMVVTAIRLTAWGEKCMIVVVGDVTRMLLLLLFTRMIYLWTFVFYEEEG